jgi:hypothetical protein
MPATAPEIAGFTARTVIPSLEDLAFRLEVPDHWRQLPIPQEKLVFSNPAVLTPACVFMATFGAASFSVAARPAYESGTLTDWLHRFYGGQDFAVDEDGPPSYGEFKAAAVSTATQHGAAGPMKKRVAVFEDGARLFIITATAPESSWPSVSDTFDVMFDSFSLVEWRGPTVAVA